MQVYLPAIEGHVPDDMVQAMRALIDFCYIARHNIHDTHSLEALDDTFWWFHHYREIFQTCGVRDDGFNLPRQHSLAHYKKLIRAYGAPNGLCSSITESKHIKAVKEPWRCSNHFQALYQMLLMNQRLDKLVASHAIFTKCGMLEGMCLLLVWERLLLCKVYPDDIAFKIDQPDFTHLIQRFLHKQESLKLDSDTSLVDLPTFHGKITVYPSAVAMFHAPSDISGVGGMHRERIRAVKSWRKGLGRYDTVFVNTGLEAIHGLDVARVQLFFSFSHEGIKYPCALVCWFYCVGNSPDENTGMWVVAKLDRSNDDDAPPITILHLDTIVHAAHLLPIFGCEHVLRTLSFTDTLDKFTRFYVNKYISKNAGNFQLFCWCASRKPVQVAQVGKLNIAVPKYFNIIFIIRINNR
ncbi:hypothetical protein EDB83DRAFT_2230578 [Lactarius deliciosus]|nr:hypothetical protein EDB83DRAFT_2230578 [Lactarius deliciosus]